VINKDEYSSYKIAHHSNKIKKLKIGEEPGLLQVHLVPSNICNERCKFCAYRMKDYPSNQLFNEKNVLSYPKIVETIDSLSELDVRAIQYTGGGEPLVHPYIKDVFEHSVKKNMEIALVSNGLALNDELCELLGDKSSWVRISVDCSNRDTYSSLRGVNTSCFDRVIDNIKSLVRHNKNSIIGVGFVVEKENYEQIYDAAKLFKDLGVNNFRISAAFTPEKYDYFKDFIDEAKDLSARAASLSDDNYTVFNLFNDRIKDNFEGSQKYDICRIKDLQVYIAADYNVYTCCTLAYNKKGLIGSIKDQSFEQLWNSDERKEFYRNHRANVVCDIPCMYQGKNEFINYIAKPNPRHINFI